MSKRRALWTGAWSLLGLVLLVGGWNAPVTAPVASALKDETKVHAIAYRSLLLDPSKIVFDIRFIDPDASMLDVDRSLFDAAESLKAQRLKAVILAYKGRGRFQLDGDRFQTIGEERGTQNPIYVVRTLPEAIKTMNREDAFPTWTDGLLGVLGKQMQEHEELHYRWYLLSLAGRDPDGPLPSTAGADS